VFIVVLISLHEEIVIILCYRYCEIW
jgi:hypothetical protein